MYTEQQRKYARDWYHAHKEEINAPRRKKAPASLEIDKYSYRVVPKNWRNLVPPSAMRETYSLPKVTSPILLDLLAGKTVFVDYSPDRNQEFNHPFRSFYSFFRVRGLRLRVHVFDNPDTDEFRKLLMWAEKRKFEEPNREEEAA